VSLDSNIQPVVDAAVLMLVQVPFEERADMMTRVGSEFEEACEREFPHRPHSKVIEARRCEASPLSSSPRVKEIRTCREGIGR
jgi:hypothetical protein